MSRKRRYGWVVAAALVFAAGCCGTGSTHKCDFSPPDEGKDAGSDAGFMCGTQKCGSNQQCCITKTPPFANCIDPKDFNADGCEMFQLQQPPCLAPDQCDAGSVCCYQVNLASLSCQKPTGCPGDGTDTYRTCTTDQDCPRPTPGVCTSPSMSAGSILKVCAP
ncbi:MAG: hypothetical protein ABUS79_20885 [Pseudomonadota bacterium]